jgi:hypothetical protein
MSHVIGFGGGYFDAKVSIALCSCSCLCASPSATSRNAGGEIELAESPHVSMCHRLSVLVSR